MSPMAQSFEVRSASPDRVARALQGAIAEVGRPAGALVFASGAFVHRLEALAETLGDLRAGVPIVVVGAAGVLSERGEIEDRSAATGIVWRGGTLETAPVVAGSPEELGEAVVNLLADRTRSTDPTVLFFVSPDGFGPQTLAPLRQARGTPHVFGAGTTGHPGSVALDADGGMTFGPVAVVLRRIAPPIIRTAHSCRLLGPLRPVTRASGSLVLEIDGRPALDVLTEIGSSLPERPLLLTVLAEEERLSHDVAGRPAMVIRGVQGVDPTRRGLVISDEVYEGMRMTFGVRDRGAARDDLEALTREIERDIAGAAPRFGLYMNCAGRGTSLYGSADVDTKILTGRFPGVPIAGMQSSFEIAPHAGRPTLQLYTGVFGLFTAPS